MDDSDLLRQLDQLEDPRSQLSALWNREHDQLLIGRLLRRVQAQFNESTRQAFRRTVLDGADVREVAAELSMTPNAVTIAKHRVLKALRREGRGMLAD